VHEGWGRVRVEERVGVRTRVKVGNRVSTRLTPASTRARLQGGVRPKWLHGSSVTYAVAPAAAWPASNVLIAEEARR